MSNSSDFNPLIDCPGVSVFCPVEWTIYGYAPDLGANLFFVITFALCALANLVLGTWFKTWTYALAMVLAGLSQAIGYVGRVLLHYNAYNYVGFQIQICCLILGPAFNTAAIYLVLKHVTLCFGPEFSKIRPNWYTYIFITGDLVSLVIQAIGGAIAATSLGDHQRQQVGDRIMMTGISFQVVTLLFFAAATAFYVYRRHQAKPVPFSSEASAYLTSRSFRLFAWSVAVAFVALFVRCVYRIVEMSGGWGNPIMRHEASFIVLDGCMVALATLLQTVFHPGFCFPRLATGYLSRETLGPVSTLRRSTI